MDDTIANHLHRIQERIHLACHRCRRDPKQVRLLAVSKTRPAHAVQAAMAAGQRLFGENRVMEARDKTALLQTDKPQWHLIGPLQRNKAKVAVKLFQMIHSLDSLPLAQALDHWVPSPQQLPVLIQVNIGKESQKHGVSMEGTESLIRSVAELPGLKIQGLMLIPPQTPSAEGARPYFQALAHKAQQIENQKIPGVAMTELSMGMSHDFEIAIEEGATLVRIGSALFGKR